MPVGEILTEICVLMLKRHPVLGYIAPLSGNLASRRANPGATTAMLLTVKALEARWAYVNFEFLGKGLIRERV